MTEAEPSVALVSVVVPTHNRVGLLERAAESVLVQSQADLELIIVDDASTDGTADYVAALRARDPRVQLIRNPQSLGGSGTRNVGIARSRGTWTAFLDDDDEWLPNKLRDQLHRLAGNPQAVACGCSYVQRYGSRGARRKCAPAEVTVRELLIDNILGGASTCLCLSTTLREVGGFDTKLTSAQDLDLWVRLRMRGPIVTCPEALVLHRVHSGSRITTDMKSQYTGARHFYFKHRGLMDRSVRRHRVAFNCFIMSRQGARRLHRRLRYLVLAMRNCAPAVSLSYAKSSAPRLLWDAVSSWRGRPARGRS